MPDRYELLLKGGTGARAARRRGASSTQKVIRKKGRLHALLLGCLLWGSAVVICGFAYSNVKHYLVVDVQRVVINSEFKFASRDEVSDAIAPLLAQSFFTLPLEQIKLQLEELDWVYRAAVRRQWPNGLVIDLQEQKPIARWGDSHFVNLDGEVFRGNGVLVSAKLPTLSGPAGTETLLMNYYLQFTQMLKRHGLALNELTFDSQHRLFARLQSGLPIVFGDDHVIEKMQRFLVVYSHALAGKATQPSYIDLRYSNGLAVRWRDGDAVTTTDKKYEEIRREKAVNG